MKGAQLMLKLKFMHKAKVLLMSLFIKNKLFEHDHKRF